MRFVVGIEFGLGDLDLGLELVFQQFVENQLLFIPLRLVPNRIVLIKTPATGLLHQQLSGDEFVQEFSLTTFLLIAGASGLGELTPPKVKFSLSDGSSIYQGDDRFFLSFGASRNRRPKTHQHADKQPG